MAMTDDEIIEDLTVKGVDLQAFLPKERDALLHAYRLGILAAARVLHSAHLESPTPTEMAALEMLASFRVAIENMARAPIEKKTKAYGDSTHDRVGRILVEIRSVASAYGVTSWEREFLHSIRGYPRLSEKQRATLAKIEGKVFGDQDDRD